MDLSTHSDLQMRNSYLALSLFWVGQLARASLHQEIQDAADRVRIDSKLVKAIVEIESNYSKTAISNKGAMGLMQVMPKSADECGIRSPYHSVDNLMGACECLRRLINRYRGNLRLALAAYNAGPSVVDKYGKIPPYAETTRYVSKILQRYDEFKRVGK